MIGSPLWRLLNYGFLAFARYLYFSFLRQDKKLSLTMPTLGLEMFAETMACVPKADVPSQVALSRQNVDNQIKFLQERLNESKISIKSVLEEDSSLSRLVLLDFLIRNFEIETFIETGTQHGLSASVVDAAIFESENVRKCLSIDVTDNGIISVAAGIEYVILERPARNNFKKICAKYNEAPVLFFHDSDHSYENMYSEFDFAWNDLKVSLLLSDDIDGNSAFHDFCKRYGLSGYRIMIDKGPALGIIIR
jgi:hypothetical protein